VEEKGGRTEMGQKDRKIAVTMFRFALAMFLLLSAFLWVAKYLGLV
jgi:hypothetical protein